MGQSACKTCCSVERPSNVHEPSPPSNQKTKRVVESSAKPLRAGDLLAGAREAAEGAPKGRPLIDGRSSAARSRPLVAGDLLTGAREAAKEGAKGPGRSFSFDTQSEGGESLGASSVRSRSSVGASSVASRSSSAYGAMNKEEKAQAKLVVKQFVKEMIKGKSYKVVLPNGELRSSFCTLTRKLDTFCIKASKSDKRAKEVPMKDIQELLSGSDTSQSFACEGLETPLDDMCVTMALSTQDCITFRFPDAEAQDKFVMCMTMFANEARGQVRVLR